MIGIFNEVGEGGSGAAEGSSNSLYAEIERLRTELAHAKESRDDAMQIARDKLLGWEKAEVRIKKLLTTLDTERAELTAANQRILDLDGQLAVKALVESRFADEQVRAERAAHALQSQINISNSLRSSLRNVEELLVAERKAREEAERMVIQRTNSNRELMARCATIERETVERLQAWAKRNREGCHSTYNGGHHDEPAHSAFHHGMDTVFNVLDHALNALLPKEGE